MQDENFKPVGDVLSDLMKRLVENDPALTEEEIDDAVFGKQVTLQDQEEK